LRVFLLGDNAVPKDEDILIAILETAFLELANDCSALKLLTTNSDVDIIRTDSNGVYVRMPELPKKPTDILDIDKELVPALARIMASYISKDLNKKAYHRAEAEKIIKQYESKVRAYMQQRDNEGAYDYSDSGVVYA